MKLFLFFLSSLLIMIACHSSRGKDATQGIKSDSVILAQQQKQVVTEKKDTVLLKNIVLTEKTVSAKKSMLKLPRSAYEEYSIASIDSNGIDQFDYFIYDSVYSGKNSRVMLLSRSSPDETIVWLAVYNARMQLTAVKKIYYSNSEGNLSIESSISNNKIIITTDDIYEESAAAKKMTSWYIDSENNIRKVK